MQDRKKARDRTRMRGWGGTSTRTDRAPVQKRDRGTMWEGETEWQVHYRITMVYLEVSIQPIDAGRGEGEGQEVGEWVPVPELTGHQQRERDRQTDQERQTNRDRQTDSEGKREVYLEVGIQPHDAGRGEGEGQEVGEGVPVPELTEHQQTHYRVHVGVACPRLQRHCAVASTCTQMLNMFIMLIELLTMMVITRIIKKKKNHGDNSNNKSVTYNILIYKPQSNTRYPPPKVLNNSLLHINLRYTRKNEESQNDKQQRLQTTARLQMSTENGIKGSGGMRRGRAAYIPPLTSEKKKVWIMTPILQLHTCRWKQMIYKIKIYPKDNKHK